MRKWTSFAASALPATHPTVAKPLETRGSRAAPAGDGRVHWKWHRGSDSTGLPTCPPESKNTLWQSADSCGEHEVPRAPRSIFLRGGVTWDALPCDVHCCFLAFSCPLQGSARPPSQSVLLLSFPPEISGWGAVAKMLQTVDGVESVLGEHACAKQAASAEDLTLPLGAATQRAHQKPTNKYHALGWTSSPG